jgi:hypothetical protein
MFVSYNYWQTLANHHLDRISEHGAAHLYPHPENAYAWSFDPADVKDGDVIFVKTDFLSFFVKNMLPRIREPFALITGHSDLTPSDSCAKTILENSLVYRWLAMHMAVHHPKLTHLPIGLAEPDSPTGDQRVVRECMEKTRGVEKKRGIFVPPMGNSHPSRSTLPTSSSRLPFRDYLEKVAEYEHVLCPAGNGIDVHRVYEALLMRTVPVYVARDGVVPGAYADLPVVVVHDPDDIDPPESPPSVDWERIEKMLTGDITPWSSPAR